MNGEHPGQADARWHRGALGRGMGGRRIYAFDRSAERADVFSIDTPPPTVSGSLHMGHVFSYTHTDIDRPLPAHERQGRSSTRWAGTTTACRPSAASRTTTACAAIRASRTSRASSRRSGATRRRITTPVADLAAELPRALRRAGRDRRAGLRGACSAGSACRSTGRYLYTTIDERSRRRQPAGVPAQPRTAARRTARKRRRCGTSTSARPSPRPRWRTASGRAPTTSSPSTATDGDGDVEIDTTRPELLAACVALVAHPDDERYQPLFGTTVRTPLYGVEVPVARPRARRARQGHRHRHDLHVRRHHRRHLVARAGPRRCGRSSAATGASSPTPRPTSTADAYADDRRPDRQAGADRRRRAAHASPASCSASRGRSQHPVKFYERGEPPARDRHQPPVVHPQRRP